MSVLRVRVGIVWCAAVEVYSSDGDDVRSFPTRPMFTLHRPDTRTQSHANTRVLLSLHCPCLVIIPLGLLGLVGLGLI